MVLRKSFYIRWSAGRSPRVHEVNPGRDPSEKILNLLTAGEGKWQATKKNPLHAIKRRALTEEEKVWFYFFFFWIIKNYITKRAMPHKQPRIQEAKASRDNENRTAPPL